MHCLREPATALGSLLSVALSSTVGKQFHLTISGGFFTPLKFKIVLDMGYTSLKYFCSMSAIIRPYAQIFSESALALICGIAFISFEIQAAC